MSSIKQDFYDGIYEIFSEFFGEVDYYPFDSENIPDDLYNELFQAKYLEPVRILAKPSAIDLTENPIPCNDPLKTMSFVVPLKSLDSAGLSSNTEELRKGFIKFKDVPYMIHKVVSKLSIQGDFLTYDFLCEEDLRRDYSNVHSSEDGGLEQTELPAQQPDQ